MMLPENHHQRSCAFPYTCAQVGMFATKPQPTWGQLLFLG